MDRSDIIKYQLSNEIIKNIHKKKDIFNIILVCRAWYHCGIKYLYRDFSYEYTLLKIPTQTQLEWVKHYHTWIDAAEEKRHFQLYTLIKGMKRLESIHIDIFGHIKYFKKYRKFLYKFADLKKDQIKTLRISLDILDENISDNSLVQFKTIFTQFIKIFKNLDVLILESGEENSFLDIQRLMIECLTDIYDNKRDLRTIISDTELTSDSEDEIEYDDDLNPIRRRKSLKKLIIYDNNNINIETSLSDIISKVPMEELNIRSYLPRHTPESICTLPRSAEPFWRINRYKKELINTYPEYFSSLVLESQNNKNNNGMYGINQFTSYENFCNRSKDRIWRKLYFIYYENLKKREEDEERERGMRYTLINTDCDDSFTVLNNSSLENDSLLKHSSSLKSICSSISDLSDASNTTIVNSFSSDLSNPSSTYSLNKSTTIIPKKSTSSDTLFSSNCRKDEMKSLCLENCQSISVNLFSIIVSKLSFLSTIKLDNISFLPEFCVMKLLIGSGKSLQHLELNMASHQLTPDIIVCIATENNNLNTLCLKSSNNPLTVDVETLNWMLTLCHQLYSFKIENAEDEVHRYYKKNYNLINSSFHYYKKTILNRTA
ncbi:hypothetical protein LY90DRAFT_664648 [Neocallimastix californiae]|uniref:Uncharacterized protein n=1 Tax=Neocallimastix californiae TaxID=1754190 RepID=A0A1Y2F6T0_9FUNG|nr:hypothetical protein LY90DRAFT_664648 [Neocallimastix californiae]|eukprot:ORY79581.1 hypothetical protein LY90DRAFT_664648 [Neocallimastix californiae]